MESVILSVLPQLSIGVVAVLALVYTVNILSKRHREEMDEAREERKLNHQSFMEFIQSNNHTVTDLVKESTEAIKESRMAIVESGNFIKKSTEALTIYNDRMRR